MSDYVVLGDGQKIKSLDAFRPECRKKSIKIFPKIVRNAWLRLRCHPKLHIGMKLKIPFLKDQATEFDL